MKVYVGISKQYVVQREDIGYYIEVEVTPATSGGKTGEAKTFRTAEKIKDGWQEAGRKELTHYLFIQFGHNDCSVVNTDRFVPIGEPNTDGKYPSTPGTPNEDGTYPDDCGGTFKWFLEQYVNAAKDKEAIPVLITPVSRMYYQSDGKIKPHHDCEAGTNNTYVSSNNAYVEAVKQVAEEQDVLLINAFEVTKAMYGAAYTADPDKSGSSCKYGQQIMSVK